MFMVAFNTGGVGGGGSTVGPERTAVGSRSEEREGDEATGEAQSFDSEYEQPIGVRLEVFGTDTTRSARGGRREGLRLGRTRNRQLALPRRWCSSRAEDCIDPRDADDGQAPANECGLQGEDVHAQVGLGCWLQPTRPVANGSWILDGVDGLGVMITAHQSTVDAVEP